MTHAFNDILARRDRRQRRLAKAAHLARRAVPWAIALAGSAALVAALAGFAEARQVSDATFEPPWQWLPRVGGEAVRQIAPLTGALLVLFIGGWLTAAGIGLLRLTLRLGYGPLAVARSVLDEAVRNKTVLILLVILLIGLAWWPYSSASTPVDVRQPLRYQIQSFLSFSSLATALLLGAVTILFAANSVSQDINVRRTGDVFVKPIGRVTYLVGKWLGVVSMMAVILLVETVLAWGVARLWLGTGYALDPVDLLAVQQRVLTARAESRPAPEKPFAETARERLTSAMRERPEATEQLMRERGTDMVVTSFVLEEQAGFLRVPINETRPFVFAGLGQAKAKADALEQSVQANREEIARRINAASQASAGGSADAPPIRPQDVTLERIAPVGSLLGIDVQPALLQWRFKVKGLNTYRSVSGAMVIKINGQTLSQPVTYVLDEVQVRDLPATYVDAEGKLEIEIQNTLPDSNGNMRPIEFDTGTWMQIYYVEGTFGGNLTRGAAAHLVRLAFLAMLGLAAGALWSFPVAATFSLSLWLLAAGGSWLDETLSIKAANTEVLGVDAAVNSGLLPLVRQVASALSTYSRLDVGGSLVDGMNISAGALFAHATTVGVFWMGFVLLLGGYLFRRREIARVQV